ncbi:malate synthase G [Sphingosinicella sp. CPCC 101087]|uniref:malate synthase G n=1 Tax=Sphingosinicella sp. CPCC 101087 TaxID=2497754 RepID=UPI00101CA61F|nr:malate synthase G [Sphingosinicella sp. CPCC 101087]
MAENEQLIDKGGIGIAAPLVRFIEERALPDTGIDPNRFWEGMAQLFAAFAPENRALLETRRKIQARLDDWHQAGAGRPFDQDGYQAYLRDIGYLLPEPAPFQIGVENVDEEVAGIAAPQLVVPVLNARFLLNAVNARWGSLYDALYGTDAIPGPRSASYDPERGARVIAWAKAFLDRAVPLSEGSWATWTGGDVPLLDPAQLVGRAGDNLLFRNHGLHIEVVIDPSHPIGRDDPAGIADVVLESAATTICDLEDSVAAVDADDKVAAYANWLGVMRGDLTATFEKNGRTVTRALMADRHFVGTDGAPIVLHGRSLLFVRNVGLHMETAAVRLADGSEAPEGILDAIVTSLIGLHDLNGLGRFRNSRTGSIYIVKPKLHGPHEAAFTDRLFDGVEDLLGLPRHTIKVGVMDEERRTSANLAACIEAVRNRIVFINTGFLDRTGDEIHTSMHAGPMMRKDDMKGADWIRAYEDRNVKIGLACGLSGKGQIGKGMWAAPDLMAEMLEQKVVHPRSGASTAWVPSPTAATLHAIHYHDVDVFARQRERASEPAESLERLLTVPLAHGRNWDPRELGEELENNAQGILGYVVRWVDQGLGCSKVPDIRDIGLMEDRATLRISSQHIANWLLHNIVTPEIVDAAFARMAAKVDAQNRNEAGYQPLVRDGEPSLAYQAARALVFEGLAQPNGYTEALLHRFRKQRKAADAGARVA